MSRFVKKTIDMFTGSPKKNPKGSNDKNNGTKTTVKVDRTKQINKQRGKQSIELNSKPTKVGNNKKKALGSRVGNDNSNLRKPMVSDPFLNFGPITREFLNNGRLGGKKLSCVYHHETNAWEIDFTFCELDGIHWSKEKTLNKDEYMTYQDKLKGIVKPTDRYIAFVTKLLIRLQINLTDVVPRGPPNLVMEFIEKHLSPLEKAVLVLSDREWDTIDSEKLSKNLVNSRSATGKYYPGGRNGYLKDHIIGSNMTVVAPFDWYANGQYSVTKQTLLKDFQVKNVITEDDGLKLTSMIEAITGASSSTVADPIVEAAKAST